MKKLKSGYINGTRVTLGNLNDFLSTSCITNLSFLGSHEDGLPDKLNQQVHQYLEEHSVKSLSHKSSLLVVSRAEPRSRKLRRRMSVRGAVRKTRSINVDCKLYWINELLLFNIDKDDIFMHTLSWSKYYT